MQSTQPSADGVFFTSRVIPYTPAHILAAFANPDLLARWWGPDGFTNTFEVFEFKPQGVWKFVMHGPDGADYANENVFLETALPRVVVRHVCEPLFTLTVSLTAVDAAHTRIDWHQALDDAEFAKNVAHIIVPANEQNLNRLEAVLQSH